MRDATKGAWLACAFVAACGSDPNRQPPEVSCELNPDPHCEHPIDRILVPKLRELGVPIRDASAEELCRRMAIDLVGRGPTAAEMTACASQTAGQMFDMFVAKPEYLREQRRQWGELYKYEIVNTVPEELVDLDQLVGELYADNLKYDEYATLAAMHPVLEHLHPADSWTTYVWNLYLGRPARQDEIDGMRAFTLAWNVRGYCSGAVWFNHYQGFLQANPGNEAGAIAEGDRVCSQVPKLEWGFNLCACVPGFFNTGCVSDVLGQRVELTPDCPNPSNYGDIANFMRVSERSPGPKTCPDGTTRPECNDRLIAGDGTPSLPFVPWRAPTAEVTQQIRGVGAALAARGDFWEAAADREVHKLLGWWQATFRHPDSDIPQVRTVLADELKANGSLRAVQRLLVTSLLYAQPAESPSIEGLDALVEHMPPWIAGPTKLLAGESWLVTATNAVGETAGMCDFRAVSFGYYAQQYFDGRYLESYENTLDNLTFPGFSINSIVRLSGCNTDSKRPEVSNIGLTFNQADIARTLCAYGSGVPTQEADFAGTATALIRQIWHRSPRVGEAEAMANDMNGCVAVGDPDACEDNEAAVRWMCQRMIDSAEFATY